MPARTAHRADRRLLRYLPPLLLLAAPAAAAERSVAIGTVERVRIEGTLKVAIVTGGSPSLTIEGERRAIEALDVRTDGTVLSLRSRATGGDPLGADAPAEPIAVTLTTPMLRSLLVVGSASVDAGAMKADSVDVSLSGNGQLSVAAIDADRAATTLIGNGTVRIGGGYAGSARLIGNGSGAIDAAGFEAGDLIVHLDGPGTASAKARYTAQVIDSGLGQVTIAGRPKCSVKAAAGGPVSCGGSGD